MADGGAPDRVGPAGAVDEAGVDVGSRCLFPDPHPAIETASIATMLRLRTVRTHQ